MNRVIAVFFALVISGTALAQSKAGFYEKDGSICRDDRPTVIGVGFTVRTTHFIPGEYARYAQKYLGVRALLSEKTETRIVRATLKEGAVTVQPQNYAMPKYEKPLPENILELKSVNQELQAKATAEMIFSLRKHRLELVTGEAGEHVFGAGLEAALNEIERLEKNYLEMFYGKTEIAEKDYSFSILPASADRNVIVCRFRDGVGVVPVSDLSGEAVVLQMTPQPEHLEGVRLATVKDKIFAEVNIPAVVRCTLICGLDEVATADIAMYQMGTVHKVVLSR